MKRILVLILLTTAFAASANAFKVYDNKVENLIEPLAVDTFQPRFSWKLSGAEPQYGYRLLVASSPRLLRAGKADLWDSGIVNSTDQVLVPDGGAGLSAGEIAYWKVISYAGGRKAASRPARFGVGLIGGTMEGEYIGACPGEGRSAILRKEFTLDRKKGTYILHVNSLGYHEVYVNGERVGDGVLAPAVSQLDKSSRIMSYDVTDLLRRGTNTIVLWTGSGWYKPGTFRAVYGGALVKAELFNGGPCLVTDGSWEGAFSGYCDTGSWLPHGFGGEKIDASFVPVSMKDIDGLAWGPVDVVNPGDIIAYPQMCEPCRVVETLSPVSVESFADTAWVVDFGKAVNAMLSIKLPELPKGTQVRAMYSDCETFDVTSNDYFISSGRKGGDLFENRFNHHVFRYVYLYGLPSKPELKNIQARRMRTDFLPAGTFECSNEDLNKVYDMVSYTMENLAFDGYMVDCANIERLGYGGDGNASTLSLQTAFDVAPLYRNWLLSWRENVREDGSLPHTAPCPYRAGGGPYWCSFIVQAPYRTWMNYGDIKIVEDCYASMEKWLEYVDANSENGLLKPWENTNYRHWYLGDWLAPKGIDVRDPRSIDLINNCVLSQCYAELEKMASALEIEDEAAGYASRKETIDSLINASFYNPADSTYASGSQIDLAYPLLAGVVPDSLVGAVTERLERYTLEERDGHIAGGLVGVPIVTACATRAAEADLFAGMLLKHDYPGYLNMMDNGSSTVWESWEGRRSRLHNCYNGILSWFYEALGGLTPMDPGYRTVRIDPQFPESVDWAKITKETPYGTIKVSWERSGNPSEAPKVEISLPSGVVLAE
ncbi:MAG: glycoside hydrolase family 78 protein [Bacteroidales bacterium]|nr:glycoside hydrolase family 78 protein [Bacteroidales bacterium]